MLLSYAEALGVFTFLGYHTCKTWEAERIIKKLNMLPSLVYGTPDLPPSLQLDLKAGNPQLLVTKVCRAVDNKEQIELEQDSKPARESKPPIEGDDTMAKVKTKKAKRQVMCLEEYEGGSSKKEMLGTKADNATKRKQRRKPDGHVDQFGSRIGSKFHKVNLLLSKKPMKMSEVKKKMGTTYYNHLNKLVKQGLVVKSEEGYALPK